MNDTIIRLIQEDLDGVLSPADRSILDKTLAEDREARSLHADLGRIGRAIAGTPLPAVPADFTRRVMDRLPAAPQTARPSAQLSWWTRVVTPANRRMAFAFAIGAFLTIAVVGTLDGPLSFDPSTVSGTMAPVPGSSRAIVDPPGSVDVIQDAEQTLVVVEFETRSTPFTVTVEGPDHQIDGVLVPAAATGVRRSDAGLSIDASGSARIVLPGADASWHVSVLHDRQMVFETRVSPSSGQH